MTATTDNTTNDSAHPSKPSYDDLNVPVIVLIGAISAVITYTLICLIQGLFFYWDDAIQTNRQQYETSPYQSQFDEQLENLTVYRREAESEKVAIPINKAMDSVIKKFAPGSAKVKDQHQDEHKESGHDKQEQDKHSEKQSVKEKSKDVSDKAPKESDNSQEKK